MDSNVTATPLRGQDALHPDGQYNSLAKWFHWLTVPLLGVALVTGPLIAFIKDADKMPFYQVHESAGVLVAGLAVLRLLWRLMTRTPATPDHMWGLFARLAGLVHFLLYIALIVQPVLGFLATNAFGFPLQGETSFLGLVDFPKFMETNEEVAQQLLAVHALVGQGIMVLLALHILGAVFHHALRRDGTLLRML